MSSFVSFLRSFRRKKYLYGFVCYTKYAIRYRREVKVMRKLRGYMIMLLAKYGCFGAGMPSIHGSYEAPVPKALQKTAEK